jgi:hypothetical protein
VDAHAALAELLELSSQVREATVLAENGAVLGTAPADSPRAAALAAAVPLLLERAGELRRGSVTAERLEVTLPEGGIFVVCSGGRIAAALTASDPVGALVVYDLTTCLHRLADATEGQRA